MLEYASESHLLTASAFNDIAEHDIEWGNLVIGYVDDYDDPTERCYEEHYLSESLAYLHQIAAANTYGERIDLTTSNQGTDFEFLFTSLSEPHGPMDTDVNGPYHQLSNITKTEREQFVRKPFLLNDDPRSTLAWSWAHAKSALCFREDQYALRQTGYIMWDQSRISFDGDWHDIANPEEEPEALDRRIA